MLEHVLNLMVIFTCTGIHKYPYLSNTCYLLGIDNFNIVHTVHDAEIQFIKPTLHALKCEHNRHTFSYMFQH